MKKLFLDSMIHFSELLRNLTKFFSNKQINKFKIYDSIIECELLLKRLKYYSLKNYNDTEYYYNIRKRSKLKEKGDMLK